MASDDTGGLPPEDNSASEAAGQLCTTDRGRTTLTTTAQPTAVETDHPTKTALPPLRTTRPVDWQEHLHSRRGRTALHDDGPTYSRPGRPPDEANPPSGAPEAGGEKPTAGIEKKTLRWAIAGVLVAAIGVVAVLYFNVRQSSALPPDERLLKCATIGSFASNAVLTVNYKVKTGSPIQVALGASLLQEGVTGRYNDQSHDVDDLTISKGSHTVTRQFQLPDRLLPGPYELNITLWPQGQLAASDAKPIAEAKCKLVSSTGSTEAGFATDNDRSTSR